MVEPILRVVLSVIVGVLFAIVFCLRFLYLMERRIARIEMHVDKVAHRILREEIKIEKLTRKKR